MNLGTHMPDGERRKPIEVCRSKVKVTLSIHMFATWLSHLWCVTDFCLCKSDIPSWLTKDMNKTCFLKNLKFAGTHTCMNNQISNTGSCEKKCDLHILMHFFLLSLQLQMILTSGIKHRWICLCHYGNKN